MTRAQRAVTCGYASDTPCPRGHGRSRVGATTEQEVPSRDSATPPAGTRGVTSTLTHPTQPERTGGIPMMPDKTPQQRTQQRDEPHTSIPIDEAATRYVCAVQGLITATRIYQADPWSQTNERVLAHYLHAATRAGITTGELRSITDKWPEAEK